MIPRSAHLCTAACLYLAALTAPFWMMALCCGWPGAGVAGFMRNDDSIAVAVVNTQTTQSWNVQPRETIPVKKGMYRIGDSTDSLKFDPSDTVMASNLTWVVARDGLRSRHFGSKFDGLPQLMAVVICTLVVAAAYLTAKHIGGARKPSRSPAAV